MEETPPLLTVVKCHQKQDKLQQDDQQLKKGSKKDKRSKLGFTIRMDEALSHLADPDLIRRLD